MLKQIVQTITVAAVYEDEEDEVETNSGSENEHEVKDLQAREGLVTKAAATSQRNPACFMVATSQHWMDCMPGRKKLYEEVKSGEKVRTTYERKSMQLRNQDVKGDDLFAVDKTRAALRDLHTQIKVHLQSWKQNCILSSRELESLFSVMDRFSAIVFACSEWLIPPLLESGLRGLPGSSEELRKRMDLVKVHEVEAVMTAEKQAAVSIRGSLARLDLVLYQVLATFCCKRYFTKVCINTRAEEDAYCQKVSRILTLKQYQTDGRISIESIKPLKIKAILILTQIPGFLRVLYFSQLLVYSLWFERWMRLHVFERVSAALHDDLMNGSL
ncbi:hypothetical protein V6N13_095454 [Hibiscus sabdariffa]